MTGKKTILAGVFTVMILFSFSTGIAAFVQAKVAGEARIQSFCSWRKEVSELVFPGPDLHESRQNSSRSGSIVKDIGRERIPRPGHLFSNIDVIS